MGREGAESCLMEKWPLLAGNKVDVVLVKAGQLVRARATAPGGGAGGGLCSLPRPLRGRKETEQGIVCTWQSKHQGYKKG